MSGYALAEERRKVLLQKPKQSTSDLLQKLAAQIRPSAFL